jgi:acyl-CoA synthetase (AMP-forming)/AMP-acid ligase II
MAEMQTLSAVLDRAAALFPDRIAVVDGAARVTYRDLQTRAMRLADALRGHGIRKGERVAIWLPNSLEFTVAFFGLMRLGAVAVPINTALSAHEARYILRHSGSVAVFVARTFRSRDYAAESLSLRTDLAPLAIIVVGGAAPDGTMAWDELGGEWTPDATGPDDVSVILYTSGTTGAPKGVVHSHRFLPPLFSAARRLGLTEADSLVLYLPLFHAYALMAGLVMMVAAGAKIVLMRRFDSAESLALMTAERATLVFGVPTTYFDQIGELSSHNYDLSSIRLSLATNPIDLCRRINGAFGRCLNSFGMTETASIAFVSSPDDAPEVAFGMSGKPVEGVEARVVDELTGEPVPTDVAGILLLRGPSIMLRYHDNPEATSKAFLDGGWFRTGDITRLDADGRLTFIGRAGDQFRVGGEIVDPVEVETVLQDHPAVERAAVAAVPDERLGQVGYAWVTLHRGRECSKDDLAAFAAQRLAHFKRPKVVFVIETFPTTASGKVQKYLLTKGLPRTQAAGGS